MKKLHFVFVLIALLALVLAVNSCFSPTQGDTGGMGTILIGNSGISRQVVTDAEADTLRYEVTLTGPGGTVKESGSSSLTIQVVPGTWKIQVRAYTPGTNVLRAVNETAEVNVSAGGSAVIKMVTATEVTNWVDLQIAAEGTITAPTPADRAEVIYLKGSGSEALTLTAADTILIQRKVTIIAEGFEFTRSAAGYPFFAVSAGSLTLQGPLTLNGNGMGPTTNSVLVTVTGGDFVLDGATLKNNKVSFNGGAVNVSGGSFTMKSGTISGNTLTNYGGGVCVTNGNFAMEGGIIGGNALTAATTFGSGVHIENSASASFVMSGGTIYGNTSSTPPPPAGLANTSTSGESFYKSINGIALWGNGTTGTINGVPQSIGDGVTTYIAGSPTAVGESHFTLTASTP